MNPIDNREYALRVWCVTRFAYSGNAVESNIDFEGKRVFWAKTRPLDYGIEIRESKNEIVKLCGKITERTVRALNISANSCCLHGVKIVGRKNTVLVAEVRCAA